MRCASLMLFTKWMRFLVLESMNGDTTFESKALVISGTLVAGESPERCRSAMPTFMKDTVSLAVIAETHLPGVTKDLGRQITDADAQTLRIVVLQTHISRPQALHCARHPGATPHRHPTAHAKALHTVGAILHLTWRMWTVCIDILAGGAVEKLYPTKSTSHIIFPTPA